MTVRRRERLRRDAGRATARVVCLASAGILALTGFGPRLGAAEVRFTDATRAAGIDVVNVCGAAPADKRWLSESIGAGAAWLDYDGDGRLDLYVVNGSTYDRKPGAGEPNRLYRNLGGGKFEEVTDRAGVGDRGWGHGVTVGDIDNDGDPDLYVTNMGPNVLYRNDGDGTFTDVTAAAGVGDSRWSTSAAFFDMDADGDLDLYVGNYMEPSPDKVPPRGSDAALKRNCIFHGIPVSCGPRDVEPQQDVLYRNDGKGKFDDVTRQAGVQLERPRYALGVVTLDYDNDGDVDVYVANDSVSNSLWCNDGKGGFTDVGVLTLAALNADGRAQAGMGTDAADWDDDGWLDLVVTNFSHDYNTLYRNSKGKYFVDISNLAGLWSTYLDLSWGTGLFDVDLDGDLDLFIANGHVYPQVDEHDVGTKFRELNRLWLTDGRRLVDVPGGGGPALALRRSFRGAAFADYDDDGDVDIFVTALDEQPLLMRNETVTAGHWLRVLLIGERSNRDAIGARVTVTAGGRTQIRERAGGRSYLSHNDPRLHVGLGAARRVERVDVRWPSGAVDRVDGVAADQQIVIREGHGLSDADAR